MWEPIATESEEFMSQSAQNCCSVCHEERKVRQRDFSAHAWTALTVWGEVSGAKEQQMCNACYSDFRDQLIDRHDEVELYAASSLSDLAAVHDLAGFRGAEIASKSQIAS